MANPTLRSIWKFPVKGLPGHPMDSALLETKFGIRGDRRFAITRGAVPEGGWLPARTLYVNAYADNLQKYQVSAFDTDGVSIVNPEGANIEFSADDPQSVNLANEHLANFMSPAGVDPEMPPPRITFRDNREGNWDFVDTPLSIINLATVSQIGKALGVDLHPARFRGNLLVDGLEPWEELSWVGKRLQIGTAEIEVTRPIVRCPAPGVNPESGERDIEFESRLPESFGHAYCGVYAFTAKEGEANVGQTVSVISDAEIPLSEAAAEAEDYRLWPRPVKISFCEIRDNLTRVSLAPTGPWPLPQAAPGQRLRIHMGPDLWTSEYIAAISPGHYHLEISPSETGDPATEHLRTGYETGEQLVICGPFGRVR